MAEVHGGAAASGLPRRDLGRRYEEVRSRICELVRTVDRPGSVVVPACPRWSVHDLISHLTGNCADILRGNLDGLASEAWTSGQVEERKHRSIDEILEEWAELAPSYAAMIDEFPGRYGAMALGDITVHEHDLRGALRRPGARDSESVSATTELVLTAIVHTGMDSRGLGPLDVRAGNRCWVVGSGTSAPVAPDAWRQELLQKDTPTVTSLPVGSVTADPFELFRAITGRRSARQIASFDWTVDAEPYLPAFGSDPFTLRADDLEE